METGAPDDSIGAVTGTPQDLDGRRVVVTGGGSGIGAACAERLAAAGGDVVVVDLDGAAAQRTADRVGGTAVAVDLADAAALAALCAPDGPVATADVLVNNAGLQHVSPIEDFPPERFSLLLRVMLEAPFQLVRAALPHMYASGWGRVVHVSSVHGLRASPNKSAYVAAKHGLEGLSKISPWRAADAGSPPTRSAPATSARRSSRARSPRRRRPTGSPSRGSWRRSC